jgi:hypothetical protein
MEKFCTSGDPSLLNKLSTKELKEIKMVLNTLSVTQIPKNKLRFWYILNSYVNPEKSIKSDMKVTRENLCSTLSSDILPENTLNNMFYSVYVGIAKEGLKIDLSNVNDAFLTKIYEKIDRVYFNEELSRLLKEKKSFVKFTVTDKFQSGVAGHCRTDGSSCSWVVAINVKTHTDPFIKYSSQKNSGVECYSPLECLMRTFQHELIHLIIENFCPVPRHAMHGKLFQAIALYRFGQTDFRHVLGKEEGIGVEKEDIRDWKTASFNNRGQIMSGWIVNLSQKTAKILLQNGMTVKVPYGLILPEQPVIAGEKPRIYTKDSMKGWKTFTAKIGGVEKRLTVVKLNPQKVIGFLDGKKWNIPYVFVTGN